MEEKKVIKISFGVAICMFIIDASKNIIDIVEENEIVYAVSQSGEKTKIAEMI